MFDFLKKKDNQPTWAHSKPVIDEPTEVYDAEDANTDTATETINSEPCYQIGKTEDGKVTLRLGTSHNYTTLTMTNSGVDTLIRMLEAAKEPEELDPEESDESNPT